MRRNKRSENKIELLKETKTACAYLAERSSGREVVTKIKFNRRAAFENFTRTEKANLENLHNLHRVKTFSEYLLKMPKFFDEPEFYLDYRRALRTIKTAFFARVILIGIHVWLFTCISVSGGATIAAGFYFVTLPFVAFLVLRRDLNNFTGNSSNGQDISLSR